MASFWPSITLSVVVALIILGGVAVRAALEDIGNRPTGEPVIIHLHVTLKIIVDGKQVIVPKQIGMNPELWKSHELDRYGIKSPRIYPLHTHDTTGVIHVESTKIRTFTLGQFFDVWGVKFDESCVADKCNDGSNKVRMYVNGEESTEFREHIMRDGEVITIEYGRLKGDQQF